MIEGKIIPVEPKSEEEKVNTLEELEYGKGNVRSELDALVEHEVGVGVIKKPISTVANRQVGENIIKKPIRTMEDLELEQEKLKLTMVFTQQELLSSLGRNKEQLQEFLLKKVALPVGAVGIGIAAVNKMAASKKQNNSHASNHDMKGLWKMLLPLGVNLFQTFFLKKQNEKIEDIAEDQQTESPSTVIATNV